MTKKYMSNLFEFEPLIFTEIKNYNQFCNSFITTKIFIDKFKNIKKKRSIINFLKLVEHKNHLKLIMI